MHMCIYMHTYMLCVYYIYIHIHTYIYIYTYIHIYIYIYIYISYVISIYICVSVYNKNCRDILIIVELLLPKAMQSLPAISAQLLHQKKEKELQWKLEVGRVRESPHHCHNRA